MTGALPAAPPEVDSLELEDVPRGTKVRRLVRLSQDALGRALCIPVLIARGMEDGQVFGVTAAVHGNELNGIPIIQRPDWDTRISQDFGGVRPHRALLTTPSNLVLGTDGEDDLMKIVAFYDQVKQNNTVRSEYKCGTQYTWTKLIVAAF